jgi:hypothetical protein
MSVPLAIAETERTETERLAAFLYRRGSRVAVNWVSGALRAVS